MELVHTFDKFRQIRAVVSDVDGVFTSNSCLVTEDGQLLRTMNFRDGLAVKMAVHAGLPIGIITGGRSLGVTKRFKDLGADHVYSGISDKNAAFNDFLEQHKLTAAEVLYIGDDLPDLLVLKRVGLAAAPADAVPEVLEMADYISPMPGGGGCVRDVLEKLLKLQGKWEDAVKAVAYGGHA